MLLCVSCHDAEDPSGRILLAPSEGEAGLEVLLEDGWGPLRTRKAGGVSVFVASESVVRIRGRVDQIPGLAHATEVLVNQGRIPVEDGVFDAVEWVQGGSAIDVAVVTPEGAVDFGAVIVEGPERVQVHGLDAEFSTEVRLDEPFVAQCIGHFAGDFAMPLEDADIELSLEGPVDVMPDTPEVHVATDAGTVTLRCRHGGHEASASVEVLPGEPVFAELMLEGHAAPATLTVPAGTTLPFHCHLLDRLGHTTDLTGGIAPLFVGSHGDRVGPELPVQAGAYRVACGSATTLAFMGAVIELVVEPDEASGHRTLRLVEDGVLRPRGTWLVQDALEDAWGNRLGTPPADLLLARRQVGGGLEPAPEVGSLTVVDAEAGLVLVELTTGLPGTTGVSTEGGALGSGTVDAVVITPPGGFTIPGEVLPIPPGGVVPEPPGDPVLELPLEPGEPICGYIPQRNINSPERNERRELGGGTLGQPFSDLLTRYVDEPAQRDRIRNAFRNEGSADAETPFPPGTLSLGRLQARTWLSRGLCGLVARYSFAPDEGCRVPLETVGSPPENVIERLQSILAWVTPPPPGDVGALVTFPTRSRYRPGEFCADGEEVLRVVTLEVDEIRRAFLRAPGLALRRANRYIASDVRFGVWIPASGQAQDVVPVRLAGAYASHPSSICRESLASVASYRTHIGSVRFENARYPRNVRTQLEVLRRDRSAVEVELNGRLRREVEELLRDGLGGFVQPISGAATSLHPPETLGTLAASEAEDSPVPPPPVRVGFGGSFGEDLRQATGEPDRTYLSRVRKENARTARGRLSPRILPGFVGIQPLFNDEIRDLARLPTRRERRAHCSA
jgi:hypothetical protein